MPAPYSDEDCINKAHKLEQVAMMMRMCDYMPETLPSWKRQALFIAAKAAQIDILSPRNNKNVLF